MQNKIFESLAEISMSSIGQVIDIIQGMDYLKLFACGLIACLLSATFGITWTLVKHDIQGDFGVAGFLFTF